METYPDLKFDGPTPIHQQIARWMRANIQNAHWNQNFKLQAESELADSLGVSRGTIRKAIETLIGEGLLTRIHGRGTFVRSNLILEQQPTGPLAGFTTDLVRRGIPFTTEVPYCHIARPSREITEMLELQRGQKIFLMRRIRRIADRANIYIENHLRYDLCPGVEQYDYTRNQFYTTLEEVFGLTFTWARRTYKAQVASGRIAEHLQIRKGAPVMYLEELYHIEKNTPAELTRAWFNGEQFHITTLIQREDEKHDPPGFYR